MRRVPLRRSSRPMINVAMIGAGSVVFSKTLTGDLLSFPEFRDATFTYMDIDQERLDVGAALCRKIAKGMGANPTIRATLDRREALKDADFVIVFVQVGGFDNTLTDFEIPRKYGLRFTIADTTGPGGLMRALRSYPFYRDLARDAQELCPNAYILNYTNPMSMNMLSLTRNGHDRSVGLCHSVQGTFNQLMGYLGEKPDDVAFTCAGINHMAFYTRIAKGDVDLYPRLFEAMGKPDIFKTNKVRFEMMRRLGYYVTESSEHNAEYSPWFLPHGQAYVDRFDVPIDEYLRRCDGIVEEFSRMKTLAASEDAGGFLPRLDNKKSLVPTSGKQFSPPTPQELRASWDAAQRQASADAIERWRVIGPFAPVAQSAAEALDAALSIDDAVARNVAPDESYPDADGSPRVWRDAKACERGMADARKLFDVAKP
ncbi:hypothetical protein EON77_08540, partial [bacterium]